jgi:hypothetical protein
VIVVVVGGAGEVGGIGALLLLLCLPLALHDVAMAGQKYKPRVAQIPLLLLYQSGTIGEQDHPVQ